MCFFVRWTSDKTDAVTAIESVVYVYAYYSNILCTIGHHRLNNKLHVSVSLVHCLIRICGCIYFNMIVVRHICFTTDNWVIIQTELISLRVENKY